MPCCPRDHPARSTGHWGAGSMPIFRHHQVGLLAVLEYVIAARTPGPG
jgi:hypothetical protein